LESVFDKTLTVQMSKGFSYIKEETWEIILINKNKEEILYGNSNTS
jgi:hypothetical protein